MIDSKHRKLIPIIIDNPRHNQQIEEVNVQHQEEHERLQEQLRRERARCQDDR